MPFMFTTCFYLFETEGMAEKARGNGTSMIYPSITLITYMLSLILNKLYENSIKS